MELIHQEKQQVYLQRVHQFYQNIQNWLTPENLRLTTHDVEVAEDFGQYLGISLAIQTVAGERLAELKPLGSAAILAEGLIEVTGWLDHDYVMYLLTGGPTFIDPAGMTHSFYPGIEEEGWYWINRLHSVPLLLKKPSLLQLITWVSDYEFDSQSVTTA
jgi:hypothetical protein